MLTTIKKILLDIGVVVWYDMYMVTRKYIGQRVSRIKHRCTNPRDFSYTYYGGKGIKLCFTAGELLDWLVGRSIDPHGLDIHRINNDGNYTLDNIEFLTPAEHRTIHSKTGH